jgi:SAM-dependent methyltransferase
MNSLFRNMQNDIIRDFALKNSFSEVIEIGGRYELNHKKFFCEDTKFLLTNLKGEDCDQEEDITKLTFNSDSVEAILCISVLQHVFNFDKGINEILRVLKPGGKALITNGFIFPICMEYDFFRFTPAFWKERLKNEPVSFTIIPIGNKYYAVENLLMRPYNGLGGLKGLLNKSMSVLFRISRCFYRKADSAPLGIAVIIEKNN